MAGATMPPEVLNPDLAICSRRPVRKGFFSRLTAAYFG